MKAVFKWNRGALSKRDKQFEKAQNYVDEECLKDMKEFVPVADSKWDNAGVMRDSAEIKKPGEIVYRSYFAEKQYYSAYDHSDSGNPNATRLWFETMKRKYAENIRRGVEKIFRR